MMKKMLFLMLFLGILGTVNVNSQVRIGGNDKPHDAAVLDLNEKNEATGSKSLALPRVTLTSVTDKMTNAALLPGMLVYNVGGAGALPAGLYVWKSEGGNERWVDAAVGGTVMTPGTSDTVVGLKGTYNYYCFPEALNLGCWMTDNSREGTATAASFNGTTYSQYGAVRGYYYTWAQAAAGGGTAACPAGWTLPTEAQFRALMLYINSDRSSPSERYQWLDHSELAGDYDSGYGKWLNWGTGGWWWVRDRAQASYLTDNSWLAPSPATPGSATLFSIRCVKDN